MVSSEYPHTPGSFASATYALEQFSDAFDRHTSPSNLPACVEVVIGWLKEMYCSIGMEMLPAAQARKAHFQGWKFITQPRFLPELNALANSTCTCISMNGSSQVKYSDYWHHLGRESWLQHSWKPASAPSPYHISPNDAFEKPFWYMMTLCTTPLNFVLVNPTTRRRMERPHRLRQRRDWPRSISDLLPHGPEDTFRAFTMWFYLKPDQPTRRSIDNALHGLFAACRSQISTFAMDSEALRRGIHMERRDIIKHIPSERHKALPHRLFWASFDRVITQSTELLHLLLFKIFDETQTINFLENRPGPEVFFETCKRGMSAWSLLNDMRQEGSLPETEEDLLAHQNAELVGLLLVYFPRLRKAELSLSFRDTVEKYTPRWHIPSEVLWFRLRRLILVQWRREHCAAPGCRRTSVDCGHLSFCGGCGIVRYCSRRCQKTSWKHIAAPHRLVCSSYRDLYKGLKLGPKMNEEEHGTLRTPPIPDRLFMPFGKVLLDHEQARTQWEMDSAPECKFRYQA
jgi:hypothetical protein